MSFIIQIARSCSDSPVMSLEGSRCTLQREYSSFVITLYLSNGSRWSLYPTQQMKDQCV